MVSESGQPRLDVITLSTQATMTQQRTVKLSCELDAGDESDGNRRGFPVSIDVTADSIEELERRKHLLGYLTAVASGVSS